ncbi:MAG TPA: 8-amino-7-oxononanoate synthase [Deltaproteobacteria bacterium]|nr:8-amino-7-oxononanoate synthase [Deltaproteobacteria bacterium]
MRSLNAAAQQKLDRLEAAKLRRVLVPTGRLGDGWLERSGVRLLDFCSNDLLSLAHDPALIQAAADAMKQFGTGAGASRLVTGNHPLLVQLEAELARHHHTEDAVVFGSGYLMNTGVTPTFVGPHDLILIDRLAHACLYAGAQLSGARTIRFPHGDPDAVRALLEAHRAEHPRCMVLTDTVFSMDGDRAPIASLQAVCVKHDAWLLTDDAHGLGIVSGDNPAPLKGGTLSKALAAYGGYICGSRVVMDLIRTRARTLIYSTGLPPGVVATALAALHRIETDPDWCARPRMLARRFAAGMGLPEPAAGIVPWIVGAPDRALAYSRQLEARGFLVTAIRPPTVPDGTARLRLTFQAAHTEHQIDTLIAACQEIACAPS